MRAQRPRATLGHRVISAFLAALMAFTGGVPTVALAGSATLVRVTVQNDYDGNGNVVRRVDGNGATTTFTYDAVNRLVAIDYPGGASPDVRFSYDRNGNRIGMTDWTGTTSYEYDLFDRLTGIDYPDGGFVLYEYDDVGNVTDLKYGNYSALLLNGVYTYIQYGYDPDNRLSTVRNAFTGHETTYAYDAAGNLTRRSLPNGVHTDYAYDGDGRLTNVVHRKSDNSLICGYAYTLNAIGNRTRAVETTPDGTRTTDYTYDPLDQLDTVTYPDGRFVDYDYDSFGNRTRMLERIGATSTQTLYTYDTDSRLLSTTRNGAPDETFTYDTAGNLIQRFRAGDRRLINYGYDAENRLVRYYDGTNNVEYVYNGAGERVAKVVNGAHTSLLNDPNRIPSQVLAETDTSGTATRVYEWGNELLSQANIARDSCYYFLHDSKRGSVRRIIDSTSAIVSSYEYDAFGFTLSNRAAFVTDYQFVGEAKEEQTGLVFLRARYLDTSLGRFLQRDPKDHRTGLDLYSYCANDPINSIDPFGLDTYRINNEFSKDIPTSSLVSHSFIAITDSSGKVTSTYSFVNANGASAFGPGVWEDPYKKQNIMGAQAAIDSGVGAWRMGDSTLDPFVMAEFSSRRAAKPPDYNLFLANCKHEANRLISDAKSRATSTLATSVRGQDWLQLSSLGHPGGVALDKSASVLLNINDIRGATFDAATGQILLYGNSNAAPSALPPMSLDDLAVAFKAVNQGTMPVVSIEDPVVSSPPEWPGRDCFTVRYGPFYTDPVDGVNKVLDASSKTHFGWVMFEADRQMKCLGMGKDNRTGAPVSSRVPGYRNSVDLALTYWNGDGQFHTRFWFNPKEIVIQPSPDGTSMELKKAEMQLSTECMFSSNGQVESTPDAEYFANWFTANYDAIAQEQTTRDDTNGVHYIFKELKQLAAMVGVVKWVQENHVPMDLSFLENYTPTYYDSAPSYTPRTTTSGSRSSGGRTYTVTIQGGVDYCKDLDFGTGGNPTGLAAAASASRGSETNLAWTFQQGTTNYNVTALSVDRTEKDGGFSHAAVDAALKVNGTTPLTLARFFDSLNVGPTMFGWGWQAQPYALEFKGARSKFNLCARDWEGFGEVWFNDRTAESYYKFVPSGIYNRTNDVLGIVARFAADQDILAYSYETKDTPGKLFSDNKTRLVMRLADGTLLDFDLEGRLLRVEDRNRNAVQYVYDAGKRLASISQPGGRALTFHYDGQNRVTHATLPDSHSVTYSYDGAGNLVSARYDAARGGRLLRYAYNADHALAEVRDENGSAVESRTYDVYGRVQNTTQPGVPVSLANQFSLAQRQTRVTGPEGLSRTIEYDRNHDPIRITDARNHSSSLAYNRYRDVITETSAEGREVRHYYDRRGNRMATVRPNGRADVTLLDINNNPVATFHADGGTNFSSRFDSEHVLVAEGLPYYGVNHTDYDYDARGNLTAIVDANLHTNTFVHDVRGNRVLARDARGFARGFAYDEFSRLSSLTNALGHRIDCSYDDRDNLTRVATRAGSVDSTYDAKNQLESVTQGDPGSRRTTRYTYNARGQILTVTDPARALTEYAYDARGNLVEIRHAGVVRFTYEYDGLNRLVATRYGGTAGTAQPTVVPIHPVGRETLHGTIAIDWRPYGDWGNLANLTLQYSLDGSIWTTIATLPATAGTYNWTPGTLSATSVRLRFLRPGDPTFAAVETWPFRVLNGGRYYVNDAVTAGDNYCLAPGRKYNGTTVTGLTPGDPVDSLQDIIDHHRMEPGDTVYVDAGAYVLFNDVTIPATVQGTQLKPLTLRGPTNGIALFAPLTRSASEACLFVDGAQYVTVEKLSFTGSRNGIWLYSASSCTIRDNICFANGVDGGIGDYGAGAGIRVSGGGSHLIESNLCYRNGANGGNGRAVAGNGGPGRGFGIVIESATSNTVSRNECHLNGGVGGLPGSSRALPGDSEGFGILIQSLGVPAEGNRILDNVCYENQGLSLHVVTPKDPCAGGVGRGCGIATIRTRNTTLERNTVHGNMGLGGRSWNGSTGNGGGDGFGYGILVQDDRGLLVTKNTCYDNVGQGEFGGRDSADIIGTGHGAGILLVGCPDSLVKNNLCYGNVGRTYGNHDAEIQGHAYASGIELASSSNCLVLNNTLVGSRGEVLTNGTGRAGTTVTQLRLSGGSTRARLANNVCDTGGSAGSALWIDSESGIGLVSDYNDLVAREDGPVGVWGSTRCETLPAWRTASSQDGSSIGSNPGYYDEASHDYHLRADSPAIDAGYGVAEVQEDYDSEPRPADGPDADLMQAQDIGFDEFVDADGDGLSDQTERSITRTNPAEADSDFDGLPDGWEVRHGLDPMSAEGSSGALGDPDRDGQSNLAEYLAGTQPNNTVSVPAAKPVVTGFSPAGSGVWIMEEDEVRFSADAQGAEADRIQYTWLVDGTVQRTGPSWRFLTTSESSGPDTLTREYRIELRVGVGAEHVSRQWDVVVNNRNHAPILRLMTNITARVGDVINLNPLYFDPDNTNGVAGDDNKLTVEFSGWMTNATRVVRSGDQGPHFVTVTVKDDGSPSLGARQTIQVAVEASALVLGVARPLPGSRLLMTVSGVASRDCVLEYSSDLQNWIPATNFLTTDNVLELTLPIGPNMDHGFYRARER